MNERNLNKVIPLTNKQVVAGQIVDSDRSAFATQATPTKPVGFVITVFNPSNIGEYGDLGQKIIGAFDEERNTNELSLEEIAKAGVYLEDIVEEREPEKLLPPTAVGNRGVARTQEGIIIWQNRGKTTEISSQSFDEESANKFSIVTSSDSPVKEFRPNDFRVVNVLEVVQIRPANVTALPNPDLPPSNESFNSPIESPNLPSEPIDLNANNPYLKPQELPKAA